MVSCLDALAKPFPEKSEPVHLLLVVAGVLVDPEGRILIGQRPQGKRGAGLWEFPGGKIDAGESPEVALVRELREELGIETRPCCFWPLTFASHGADDFHLLMPVFVCRLWTGVPSPREHIELLWVHPRDLGNYPMPEADTPLLPVLLERL